MQASTHLHRAAPPMPDLLETESHQVIPAEHRDQHPGPAIRVVLHRNGLGPARDPPQERMDLIDALHGGCRIVDTRRQRPLGDVNELTEPERRIPLDGSLVAHHHGPAQLPLQAERIQARSPGAIT